MCIQSQVQDVIALRRETLQGNQVPRVVGEVVPFANMWFIDSSLDGFPGILCAKRGVAEHIFGVLLCRTKNVHF